MNIKQWASGKNYTHYIVYAAMSLLILWPVLAPGFVLTLDMVFTPHIPAPSLADARASYPFYLLLHVLNMVVPADALQKIMLIAIFMAAGVGAHGLARHILQKQTYAMYGAYFAGLFYIINPFTYDRLMAGQYAVLLGYMLLPFALRSLLVLLDKPNVRNAVVLALWAVGVGVVSIHGLGWLVVLCVIGMVVAMWRAAHRGRSIGPLLRYSAVSLVVFGVLSCYWLVPLAIGQGTTASAIQQFGAVDRQAFATAGGSAIGVFGNIIRLQGFWAEQRDLFVLPQDQVPLWGLIALLCIVLVITGGVWAWRHGRRFALALVGVSAGVAVVLAMGVGAGWLAQYIPFFAGYREPQKFVALVALAYSVLGGLGVVALLNMAKRWPDWTSTVITAALFILPIALTPTMPSGANGQLTASQYPDDWATTDAQLQADPANFRVLFLPWHQYMRFDFAGRIIANPATQFFSKPTITSDNPEFGNLPPSGDEVATDIDQHVMPQASTRHDLGAQLAARNIKYVVLAQEYDHDKYDYLNAQSDLKLLSESDTLRLYLNTAWKPEVHHE